MNDIQPTDRKTAQAPGSNVEYLTSLGDLPRTIWRHKWHVFASLVATVALGITYLIFADPLYIAQARVVIERKELPLQGKQYHGGPEFFATQVEVMRSPQVLRGVMQSLGLPKPPGESPESFSKVFRRAVRSVTQCLSSAPEVDPEMAAMTNMLQSLTVNPVLGTNVLNVGYRNADPDEAVRTVQAVITEYMSYAQELEREAHAETLHQLQVSEQQLREEVTRLDEEYQALHKEGPLLGQGKDASSVQDQVLRHLAQKLTEAKNRRIDLENQLYALAHCPSGLQRSPKAAENRATDEKAPSPEPAERQQLFHPAILRVLQHDGGMAERSIDGEAPMSRDLAKMRDALWRAQIKAQELSQNYGPKHPAMRAVQEEISMWEKIVRESTEASTAALEQELTAVKLNESRLTDLYGSEFKKTKELDDFILREQCMTDELHRVQATHEKTRAELRQWDLDDKVLATGKGGVTVQVIDDPGNSMPRKLWPRTILVLAACLAFGFLGGAGLASIFDYRARTSPVS